MHAPEDERNRRILVVDDNPTIHEDFRKILCASSEDTTRLDEVEAALFGQDREPAPCAPRFEVDSALQGTQGLEAVRAALEQSRPYALAFVDVRMPPGWDGVETTVHLWETDPALQIVLCTAYSDYTWEDLARELVRTDQFLILKKPFDNIEVRQFACALTEKWDLARRLEQHIETLDRMVHGRTQALHEKTLRLEQTIQELNQVHAQLLTAQKLESIGQLAAGIAHEINTPTQFVGDNIRFLRDGFNDLAQLIRAFAHLRDSSSRGEGEAPAEPSAPRALDQLTRIAQKIDLDYLLEEIPNAIEQSLEGVGRVAKIVLSMKEFSHPGHDDKSPADLNKAIDTTVTVARNEWKYVADLVTDFDPSLPPVPCFLGDFNQVILNMIVNAAHAIREAIGENSGRKGTITISTRQGDDWAEIRIADTGTGIPREIRSRIFDPFFTTKGVGQGTGQGLAIAHNTIVKKHGGSIDLESEVGVGTTFVVRLPLKAEEDPSLASRGLQSARSSTAELHEYQEAHTVR